MLVSLLSVKYPRVNIILVKLGIGKYLLKKNEIQVGTIIEHGDMNLTNREDLENGATKIHPFSPTSPKFLEFDSFSGKDVPISGNPKNSISELVVGSIEIISDITNNEKVISIDNPNQSH